MSDTSLTGDPSRDIYFQMMLSSMLSPQSPMEYSTTKGWLPPDSGTMSQYTNTVQDWMSPDIAALIRAANGMDGGPAPTPSGIARLQAISEMTGSTSWEGLVAKAILDGSSPSEAMREVEEDLMNRGLLSFNDSGERDAWRKTVSSTATDWFDSLVEDKLSESAGNDVDSRLGLPSYGTEFDAFMLNPYLEDASNAFAESRAPALAALKDDRMAALDARMGDTDAYMESAMDAYIRSLEEPLGPQPQPVPQYGDIFATTPEEVNATTAPPASSGRRVANELVEGVTYMAPDGKFYFYDEPLTKEEMTTATLGVGFDAEDPYFQEGADRIRKATPAWGQKQDRLANATREGLLDVFESETRRDLSKARNNNAGKDYEMSGETADLVKKAKEDKDAVTREARIAYTLNKFLESKGVTPRSAAARQFLGAGQSLFGS